MNREYILLHLNIPVRTYSAVRCSEAHEANRELNNESLELTKALWMERGDGQRITYAYTANGGKALKWTICGERCHGNRIDCFSQSRILPHEGKYLYADLLSRGYSDCCLKGLVQLMANACVTCDTFLNTVTTYPTGYISSVTGWIHPLNKCNISGVKTFTLLIYILAS
jgi:hypothetical protein